MHAQTHIMSGWCIGSLFGIGPRERLFCMLAAAMADIDGISYLGGEAAFARFHHVLSHNLFFAVALAAILAGFSRDRTKTFLLYLVLAHLHLVLDYFGSGSAWRIHYLWPFSEYGWRSAYAWKFYSWQNLSAAFALLAWTILIAVQQGRTPLEVLMPSLDRQLVDWLRRKAGVRLTEPRRHGPCYPVQPGDHYGQIQEPKGHEGRNR